MLQKDDITDFKLRLESEYQCKVDYDTKTKTTFTISGHDYQRAGNHAQTLIDKLETAQFPLMFTNKIEMAEAMI